MSKIRKTTDEQLEACKRELANRGDVPAMDVLLRHAEAAGVNWRVFRMRMTEYQNRAKPRCSDFPGACEHTPRCA